jgi:hypothetical protein
MSELSNHMTQTLTPEEAGKRLLCPLARTFAMKEASAFCRGPSCAAWRFLPILANDPAFKGAVQREIAFMQAEAEKEADEAQARGEKRPTVPSAHLFHQAAVARVAADPSAYCIPAHHERGYCGVGGAVS